SQTGRTPPLDRSHEDGNRGLCPSRLRGRRRSGASWNGRRSAGSHCLITGLASYSERVCHSVPLCTTVGHNRTHGQNLTICRRKSYICSFCHLRTLTWCAKLQPCRSNVQRVIKSRSAAKLLRYLQLSSIS